MNDHEVERIAASLNMARPDWPKQQLKTLLRDERIASRPRRDVFVALAWVASEPNSHTPYRVLEAGPWWRAAGVEGAATVRNVVSSIERCSVCSQAEPKCRSTWADDHEFESAAMAARRRAESDPQATATAIHALKASIEPTQEAPVKSLDELKTERPGFAARLAAIEAQHPRPAMQEPEPEESA
jgi:hypothetical protein